MHGRPGAPLGSGRGADTAELREYNLGVVLRILSDVGPSSRAEIAEASGLGLSTLTGMIAELKILDLVCEVLPEMQPRLGRPSHAVALTGNRWVVAGVQLDVGGVQAKTVTVQGDHVGHYAERADLSGAEAVELERMIQSAVEWILESVEEPRRLVSIELACGWPNPGIVAMLLGFLLAAGRPDVSVGATSLGALSALASVRNDESGRFRDGTVVYLGGERSISGAVVSRGDLLRLANLDAFDFGRVPVVTQGNARETLDDVVSLAALFAAAGIRANDDEDAVLAFNDDALSRLVANLRRGEAGASGAVAVAASALSMAIDAITAVIGAHTVVLDGFLGELGPWLLPALVVDARVVLASPRSSSRSSLALEGAILAARDRVLARPTRLRLA